MTGVHRKHAMRLLRSGSTVRRGDPRPSRRVYGEAIRVALVVLREASDRICGKRLCPLVPLLVEVMKWHGQHGLSSHSEVRAAGG